MEEVETDRAPRSGGPAPEDLERRREREGLQLSRVRVLHDLETARHSRYREQLEAALAHLDAEIARLTV
jgi:hypothetical protein